MKQHVVSDTTREPLAETKTREPRQTPAGLFSFSPANSPQPFIQPPMLASASTPVPSEVPKLSDTTGTRRLASLWERSDRLRQLATRQIDADACREIVTLAIEFELLASTVEALLGTSPSDTTRH